MIIIHVFNSQQASEVRENNSDHDKAAPDDMNSSKVEDTENEDTKNQENKDTETSSPSKKVSKQPKNLIKLVVKGSREMLEPEEGSALQKDNNNTEEASGLDSDSARNVDAVKQAEKNVSLNVHSKNVTNVKTNESQKELVKENSTLHTIENNRKNNASQITTEMENPKSQGKTMVNVEHKIKTHGIQAQKLTEKKVSVTTTKLSPQLLAHTKHAQVTSHAKLAHRTPISPGMLFYRVRKVVRALQLKR